MAARTLPFFVCAAGGVSSVMGPSTGPYMYRLSANTSLAPAAAVASRMPLVMAGSSCGQRV